MRANKNCVNNNFVGDVDVDLYPFLLRYKDGRIDRLLRSPFVAASENPTANRGVATRDVIINPGTGVSARLFLPTRAAAAAAGGKRRLPVIVYIHGGSFCTESAFCRTYHGYATSLAATAGALVVSVEYRLAPEHPIPTAYDDAWSALQWAAASLADEPWLADHADPRRTFLAGDSAGGNIAYHTAVRAGRDGMGIEGLIMVQPFFWGAERLPSEEVWDGASVLDVNRVGLLWPFVTAGQADNDDPRLNPPDEEIASLRCQRVLIAVAEKDSLRERGCRLFDRIRDYYYYAVTGGEATLVESEGEDHGFHLYSPLRTTSKRLMESIVRFINNQPAAAPPLEVNGGGLHWHGWEQGKKMNRTSTVTTPPKLVILGVPSRPFTDLFSYGMGMKRLHSSGSTTTCTTMAYGGTSRIIGGRGKVAAFNRANYGLSVGPNKGPTAAPLPGTRVISNFF
ncbi:unnamed protein product [Urochloa humidicola]